MVTQSKRPCTHTHTHTHTLAHVHVHVHCMIVYVLYGSVLRKSLKQVSLAMHYEFDP